eukprot:634290-Ditylum_brightwellii.AAC.1
MAACNERKRKCPSYEELNDDLSDEINQESKQRSIGKDGVLLSENKGEGGREDMASLKEKPVSHFGENRREDRASQNKKPVLSAQSLLCKIDWEDILINQIVQSEEDEIHM